MIQREIKNGTIFFRERECERSKTILSIRGKIESDPVEIILSGELRSDFCEDFFDEVRAFLSVDLKVILNMNCVKYISSVYFLGLLELQQEIEKYKKGAIYFEVEKLSQEVLSAMHEDGYAGLLGIE